MSHKMVPPGTIRLYTSRSPTSKAGFLPRRNGTRVVAENRASIDEELPIAKLVEFSKLERGWNGYSAPPPSSAAIANASILLTVMRGSETSRPRLAPSAVGGVGATFRKGTRKGYIELYNDGGACVLFSDSKLEEIQTRRVQPSRDTFRDLLKEIQDYLDG